MLSRNKITYVRSLHQKKYRDKFNAFIVEGPKLIGELLNSNFQIKEILSVKSQIDWIKGFKRSDYELTLVSEVELAKVSHFKTANDLLAIVKQPEYQIQDLQLLDDLSLILDGISDPGNLGTIIRTAEWFGIRNIICSEDCVEVFNPKVVQATMGSVFRMQIVYTDLIQFLTNWKKQIPVYGTFLDGENIYDTKFGDSGLVIIGSESHGIGPEVEKKVTHRIHIPTLAGGAESLNASVAAAICLSEFKRAELKNI